MAGVWRRVAENVRARAREGWLTPLATLAGIAVVVLATAILAWPLRALTTWEIPRSQTHWIVIDDAGDMRRPRVGETPRSISDLPRASTWPGVQVFHVMDARPKPVDQLSLMLPAVSGREVRPYVNGVGLLRPGIETDRAAAAPWSTARLWAVPPAFLRPGANRIDVLIVGISGRALSAPVFFGPRAVLQRAADRQAIWGGSGRRPLAPVALAAVLASLLAALLDAKMRPPLLAVAALAAAVGARAALGDQAAIDALGQVWGATDRLLAGLALLMLGLLMNNGRPPRWPPWAFLAVAAGLAAAGGLDLAAPRLAPALFSPAAWAVILLPIGLLVLASATNGSLRWTGAAVQRTRIVATVATLALVATLTAWSGLARYAGLSGLVLDVAYVVAVTMTLTGAFVAAGWSTIAGGLLLVRTRLDLSGIVRQQRTQIEAAATALEQEMRRAAILEERQRLARDMHDGVGGQLVSLIARVRSRRITIDQVEGELVQGLSELRMVVDSLDAPGQSLSNAMLTFRLRTQNLADGAGMALDWSQNNLEGAQTSDSRWVLTLYRFMQEAVTNAVRHSGGRRLEVRAEREGDTLVVQIADDGRGFDADQTSGGKGLRNLSFRAGQLGGVVTIRSEPGGGTRIRLAAPLILD
ncbi:MAG: sensor histidine kinase [Caulobacter sp.]|nr:sensor histidine kinase [Caulobacter sp.]